MDLPDGQEVALVDVAAPRTAHPGRPRRPQVRALLVVAGLIAFAVVFAVVDQAYQRVVEDRLTDPVTTVGEATAYGVVARLHLIVPLAGLALWRPSWLGLGLEVSSIRSHWRRLLLILLANCLVVGGFAVLSGAPAAFSGDAWLVTEVVTVPLVEEALWRGLVFAVLLRAFERAVPRGRSMGLTVWASGIAFGLLHLGNALVGVSPGFAVLQALNAAVWGVAYGHARALTGSIWPAVVMHAAMNAVVVLA